MSKRRRTDDVLGSGRPGNARAFSVEPPEKSEQLWFEDGSIVLQAENTQFKVHRSILAKNSPIFADLFKIPHPASEPTIDGCPIVHLQDSAEDVKHVLLILYGDREYVNPGRVPHFSVVAAMIRLGRKYEIDFMKDEALSRLKREFPTTLEEFDDVDRTGWTHFTFPTDTVHDRECKKLYAMIRFAYECNIRSILPSLYVELMGPARDLDNVFYLSNELPMPYDALRSFVCGRDILLSVRTQETYQWIREVGTLVSCKSRVKCSGMSRRLVLHVLNDPVYPSSVFHKWEAFEAGFENGTIRELCDPCLQYAKRAHKEAREAVWAVLPTYFKLPEWNTLTDDM